VSTTGGGHPEVLLDQQQPDLLAHQRPAGLDELLGALGGNLCRGGFYVRIVLAVRRTPAELAEGR
jgi:hypothetical protein